MAISSPCCRAKSNRGSLAAIPACPYNFLSHLQNCAPVAQRLEQQTHNLLVRGSNPRGGIFRINNFGRPRWSASTVLCAMGVPLYFECLFPASFTRCLRILSIFSDAACYIDSKTCDKIFCALNRSARSARPLSGFFKFLQRTFNFADEVGV